MLSELILAQDLRSSTWSGMQLAILAPLRSYFCPPMHLRLHCSWPGMRQLLATPLQFPRPHFQNAPSSQRAGARPELQETLQLSSARQCPDSQLATYPHRGRQDSGSLRQQNAVRPVVPGCKARAVSARPTGSSVVGAWPPMVCGGTATHAAAGGTAMAAVFSNALA
jgi:hypothetical protein